MLLLLIAHLTVAIASAEEFGRVSGGEIKLVPKGSSQLSGSLGISASDQSERGYEGTLGGERVDERVWFFATARQEDRRVFTGFEQMELSRHAVANMFGAKVTGNIGDRQNLSASFDAARQPLTLEPGFAGAVVPTNFLSLRYTGVISSNSFFNVSFSRSSVSQPEFP
jgi:hypothetical protein